MSSLPFAALTGSGGFTCDPRFTAALAAPPVPEQGEDPLALALAEAHAQGRAEALTEAEAAREEREAARGRIELSLARLDAELREQLRQRLYATVEALCEAAIAPLALVATAGCFATRNDVRILQGDQDPDVPPAHAVKALTIGQQTRHRVGHGGHLV